MKAVQIRNVPEDVHRKLKARAALEGRSLSEYALAELTRAVEQPTLIELVERLRELPPVPTTESPAAALHAERDAR